MGGVRKYAKFRHFLAYPVVEGGPEKTQAETYLITVKVHHVYIKVSRTSVNAGRRIRRS